MLATTTPIAPGPTNLAAAVSGTTTVRISPHRFTATAPARRRFAVSLTHSSQFVAGGA
jgi:hypothetical protein